MPETATHRFVSATDEGALVRAARTDPHAFADLYHRHVSAIYRFCYRRLGTKEAAEDATAQVFTKALSGLAGYRGGAFRGWLFAIAYHVVVDEVRMARSDVPLTAAAASIDPGPGPEEVAVDAEASRALRALLAQLPPEQRRVVELRLAGLSGVEIAAALGRSHGTIRNLQHRTLLRLRALLSVTGSGDEANA
jgi:RNA polymerase sigma-70 factor (ECF subfamily)